jgi:hypothetical protein
VEIDEIEAEINRIELNIAETACNTPEGCNSVTWPMGVPAPYKASSRHEIIRWDYFNETHVFLGTDFDTATQMKGEF